MNHPPHKVLSTVATALLLFACQSTEQADSPPDVELLDVDSGQRDQSPAPDLTSEDTGGDDELDAAADLPDMNAEAPDALPDMEPADQGPPAPRFVQFDPSAWEVDAGCTGQTEYPQHFESFGYPPPTEAVSYGRVSREALEPLPGEGGYTSIRILKMNREVRPNVYGTNAYRTDSEWVTYYIGGLIREDYFERRPTRGMATVMVDYEPVEAVYRYYRDDWDNEPLVQTGTGVTFPVETHLTFFEISIPGEVFDEDKIYELELWFRFNYKSKSPSGVFQKTLLHNRGVTQPPRPCFEQGIDDFMNLIEMTMWQSSHQEVFLFPSHYPAPNLINLEEPLPATPGQTVRVNVSALDYLNHSKEREMRAALVPLLDGAPLQEPWFITIPPGSTDTTAHVNARRYFEVTLPEEPGIYEVTVAAFRDPWHMAHFPDGTRHQDFLITGSPKDGGGNALLFEVK